MLATVAAAQTAVAALGSCHIVSRERLARIRPAAEFPFATPANCDDWGNAK